MDFKSGKYNSEATIKYLESIGATNVKLDTAVTTMLKGKMLAFTVSYMLAITVSYTLGDKTYTSKCVAQYGIDGYDYQGYDKNGYDKDGYDRKGYDKEGFNKKGVNAEGLTKSQVVTKKLSQFIKDFDAGKYTADKATSYLKSLGIKAEVTEKSTVKTKVTTVKFVYKGHMYSASYSRAVKPWELMPKTLIKM